MRRDLRKLLEEIERRERERILACRAAREAYPAWAHPRPDDFRGTCKVTYVPLPFPRPRELAFTLRKPGEARANGIGR